MMSEAVEWRIPLSRLWTDIVLLANCVTTAMMIVVVLASRRRRRCYFRHVRSSLDKLMPKFQPDGSFGDRRLRAMNRELLLGGHRGKVSRLPPPRRVSGSLSGDRGATRGHAHQPVYNVGGSGSNRNNVAIFAGVDVDTVATMTPPPPTSSEEATVGTKRVIGSDTDDDNKADGTVTIVLISGFESFNVGLYREAAAEVATHTNGQVRVHVYTDRDLKGEVDGGVGRREEVLAAVASADAFVGSLLFDYDDVETLQPLVASIRGPRLIFECSTELMSLNSVGSFAMAGQGGGPTEDGDGRAKGSAGGPPPAVKAVLSKFGSGREEDKLAGYLELLKVGPELLRFVPGGKAADLRSWLESYRYWNQGGKKNVVSMLRLVAERYLIPFNATANATTSPSPSSPSSPPSPMRPTITPLPPPEVTPGVGLLHPAYHGGKQYFLTAAAYMEWRESSACLEAARRSQVPLAEPGSPRVAVLLYRKHVVTEQGYIGQLISLLEREGLIPIPVFINGVEAHTVVRDSLTSTSKSGLARNGRGAVGEGEQVRVDAVVSTIGFPLVGGPAGSMEKGRDTPVAVSLLSELDVPYIVAAPLLLQDLTSWKQFGVQGLQSVVLYSLPELDGAVDTIVLGGLAGDRIGLVPERGRKLARRLKRWVRLRSLRPAERKVAMVLYGFPPNVGAVGTAALLNVPRSLEATLRRLDAEGYDVGRFASDPAASGEALVAALALLSRPEAVAIGNRDGMQAMLDNAVARACRGDKAVAESLSAAGGGLGGARVVVYEVDPPDLGRRLGKVMAGRVARSWGTTTGREDRAEEKKWRRRQEQTVGLEGYEQGPGVSATGKLVVAGLEVGNVFIGVQPLLGIEGDPMRLLFERDLTPHPQYAAFYDVLLDKSVAGGGDNNGTPEREKVGDKVPGGFGADAMVHFGTHGTAEWLPGRPLGNDRTSWSDQMMGDVPNFYIYTANNPSESILAKRRGYATIVSHNVPPYGRAGLYLELQRLKDLLDEADLGETAIINDDNAIQVDGSAVKQLKQAVRTADADAATNTEADASVRIAIADTALRAGLTADVPWHDDSEDRHSDVGGSSDGGSAAATSTAKCDALSSKACDAESMAADPEHFVAWAARLKAYLSVVEARVFSSGLRVLGSEPTAAEIEAYLDAFFNGSSGDALDGKLKLPPALLRAVATGSAVGLVGAEAAAFARANGARGWRAVGQWISEALVTNTGSPGVGAWLEGVADVRVGGGGGIPVNAPTASSVEGKQGVMNRTNAAKGAGGGGSADANVGKLAGLVDEALTISSLLRQSTDEMDSLVRGLGGGYVAPAPGGDLLRDGTGVLPTGRNIYSLDPYRMPSAAAWARGQAVAERLIEQHRTANDGSYPETIAVTLWGLDAIKTKGESVAIAVALVGGRPVREGTGRIVRFELRPLEELPGGRPRVDVLASLSGIFRDSFANVLDLLDDLFEAAAAADEPENLNFVRKHALGLAAEGVARPAARLFSNPPGDYGSMVNERVGSGQWDDASELGDTWQSRNVFSYGKGEGGSNRSAERPEVLARLLETTDRVVQEVDSVEYGITDIQEYYANTGALKKAAENRRGGRKVAVSVVEAFGAADESGGAEPRELDQVLRLEYRTKLLNPKWADAMLDQGGGGAYEVSQRLTAAVGWGAVAEVDDFVFDGAAERYVFDEARSARLLKANPEAFRNVVGRLLEAAGRGMWNADEETLEKLRDRLADADDRVEGVA